MSGKILGFFLVFLGLSLFIPFALRIVIKLGFIVLGLFLIYKGLQFIGAHSILFHVDRFLDKLLSIFN